jgi:hypothetical protein
MGNFNSFLRFSLRIFCHSDDFFKRIFAKTQELFASILCCCRPYCAVGIPDDANTVVG